MIKHNLHKAHLKSHLYSVKLKFQLLKMAFEIVFIEKYILLLML